MVQDSNFGIQFAIAFVGKNWKVERYCDTLKFEKGLKTNVYSNSEVKTLK